MFPIVPPIWKLFQNEVDKSNETKVGPKESSKAKKQKSDGKVANVLKKPKRNHDGGLQMLLQNT